MLRALRGAIFNYAGKPAEGIELARMAIRHTPLVPPIFPAVLATSYYLCGRTDEAVGLLQEAFETRSHVLAAR